MTLLTIVVIEFTYSTEVDAHLTRHARSALQASYLARGGVALAELALEVDAVEKSKSPPARPPVETLLDPWALPFPPQTLGDGVGEAGYQVVDESSRYNLNSLALGPGVNPVVLEARKSVFQGVLAVVGLDVNLIFPLIDWLDVDDEVSGKNGAEKAYYGKLAPPYLPRNGRMLSVDELQLVKGFGQLTREQWRALRSLVTVLPRDDLRINVNTAPEALLTAVFSVIDDRAAGKAILARREQQPFLSVSELNEVPGWARLPQQIRSFFDVRSQFFTVHGIGIAADVRRGVAVLEQRSGPKLDVLDWREDSGALSLTSRAPSDGMTGLRP